MLLRIKRRALEHGLIGLLLIFTIISILVGVSFTTDYVTGANITNNSVLARANITNTGPNITSITINPSTIDLTPNGDYRVTCNASIYDTNGWEDINANATNATFYIDSVGPDGASDNNHRYTNSSCGNCIQFDSTTASCGCGFSLKYYANDSSMWRCNVTTRDLGGTGTFNVSDSDISATTATVNQLLAINTTTLLDYGNLSVTQTSPQIVHNVTNGGNINLNLSLRGFAGTNDSLELPEHNLTMICGTGNIPIGNQRYALGTDNFGASFSNMRTLQNQTERTNLTFFARVDDAAYGSDNNATYWKLQVPISVAGICNGTIIFGAVDAENN